MVLKMRKHLIFYNSLKKFPSEFQSAFKRNIVKFVQSLHRLPVRPTRPVARSPKKINISDLAQKSLNSIMKKHGIIKNRKCFLRTAASTGIDGMQEAVQSELNLSSPLLSCPPECVFIS